MRWATLPPFYAFADRLDALALEAEVSGSAGPGTNRSICEQLPATEYSIAIYGCFSRTAC